MEKTAGIRTSERIHSVGAFLCRLCHDVESALTCHASALLIRLVRLLVKYLECHLYEFNLNLTI